MYTKSAEIKLKKNYFKPSKQIYDPINQSIYKHTKNERVKPPSCL